eukprot:361942_1
MQITEKASGYKVNMGPKLQPIARILLIATYDDTNIFSNLRGVRYILKAIWEYVLQFNKHYWHQFIKYPNYTTPFALKRKTIYFPKPTNININMMPFRLTGCFDTTGLPKHLEPYFIRLIKPCLLCDFTQLNRICFLTINESLVDYGCTQRRPGIHTESPGYIYINDEIDEKTIHHNSKAEYIKGGGRTAKKMYVGTFGGGYTRHEQHDGIYMASSVSNTTAIWNCQIIKKLDTDVIGHLGDIGHLKSSLPAEKKFYISENCLYWLTDRTPHEALPMHKPTYRQFFRLVTYNVNLWHE